MNKPFSSLLLLLSSTFILASCGGNDATSSVQEASITLTQTSLTLEAYQETTIEYTLKNVEGTVTWTSSNPTVATVDNGKISTLKAGTATITAAVGDLSASCQVTVTALAQAPRLVMSDLQVAVDKDQTYGIDAYVLYKNEQIASDLEATLKEGEDASVASVAYSNGKLNVTGNAYGQATFIIHTKALGITLSQLLKVQVVNSSVRLAIGNLDQDEEGDYGLELATERVEGLYDADKAINLIYTEKDVPGTKELTRGTDNNLVADWVVENGTYTIKAIGNGTTNLWVAIAEYKMKINVKVTVYKGAFDVTLKNVNTDGTDKAEHISLGTMPTTPADVGSRRFLGWYDASGKKVERVLDDMTLYAHYTTEYRSYENEILQDLNFEDSSFKAIEGYHKLGVRSAFDKADDIKNNFYPEREGDVVFFPWQGNNWYSGKVGVELPAFNFSAATEPIFFDMGYHMANDSALVLEGHDLGIATKKDATNYQVTINGKSVRVYNASTNTTASFDLADEVYNGERGLQLTCDNMVYRFFVVSAFRSLLCDYVGLAYSYEQALPETPKKDDDLIATVKKYQEIRKLYTEAEANTIFPISAKMAKWIDALEVEILNFPDHGVTTVTKSGDGAGQLWNNEDWVNHAMNGTGWQKQPFSLGDNYYITAIGELNQKYATLTFPAIDFSAKKNVSFTLGFGGNCGMFVEPQLAFGAVPTGTTDLSTLDNFIGYAKQTLCTDDAWDGYANEITAVVSDGKITFNGSLFENSIFELSDAVNNGEEGLSITIGMVNYEWFVVSPFVASGF